MKKKIAALVIVVCAAGTGCVSKPRPPPRFVVSECGKAVFLDTRDCDKGKPPKRMRVEHCIVHDQRTGCMVGAVKQVNEHYNASRDFGTDMAEFVYVRVYDWECPAGVAPPRKEEFWFVNTYNVPLECDDEDAGEVPQNPLLHRRKPPVSATTEQAP